MKIIESQSAVLSNYEVLAHLEKSRLKPRTTLQQHMNVQTVLKEVTDYLASRSNSTSPEIQSPVPPYIALGYTAETIKQLVENLQPYQLTKSEVMMILNLRPTDLGLLDCVIEECDERFSSDQQEELLRIIDRVLGGHHQIPDHMAQTTTNGTSRRINGKSDSTNGTVI